MSALETTVRVSPEKQTLILAGETVPQRSLASPRWPFGRSDSHPGRPLTIVATPADETLLISDDSDQGDGDTSRGAALLQHEASRNGPASAYARVQALTSRPARPHAVDLYA